jgi:hypothetical protein
MADISRIPASVSRHLKYYVYLYVHPETGEVFYVGKGKGNRAMAHAGGDGDTPHDEVIRDLKSRGLEPRVEVLIHGLDTDREALAVEMAAIDLLSLERLTNRVHGHHSSRRGRMSLEQVLTLYQREPVEIDDPVVLIKIATSFRYGMEPVELYDLTRSCWRASGTRRDTAQYALAVHEGVVREVYRITAWLPSGSTFRHDFPAGVPIDDRWEFVGTIAAEEIRQKYLSRSVGHYFTEGSQNPIRYVNC